MCLKGHMENGQEGTRRVVERAFKQLLQVQQVQAQGWVCGDREEGPADDIFWSWKWW